MIPRCAEIYNRFAEGDLIFAKENAKIVTDQLKNKIYNGFLVRKCFSSAHAMCLSYLNLNDQQWFDYLLYYAIYKKDKFLLFKLCKNTNKREFKLQDFTFTIPAKVKVSTEIFNLALQKLNTVQCKILLKRNEIEFDDFTYLYAAQNKKSRILNSITPPFNTQEEFDDIIKQNCGIKKISFYLNQNPNLNVSNAILYCIINDNYTLFNFLIKYDETDKNDYLAFSVRNNKYTFFRNLYDIAENYDVNYLLHLSIIHKNDFVLSFLFDYHKISNFDREELSLTAIMTKNLFAAKYFCNKSLISINLFNNSIYAPEILQFYLENKYKIVFGLSYNYNRHGCKIYNYSFNETENLKYEIMKMIKEATTCGHYVSAEILSQHVWF